MLLKPGNEAQGLVFDLKIRHLAIRKPFNWRSDLMRALLLSSSALESITVAKNYDSTYDFPTPETVRTRSIPLLESYGQKIHGNDYTFPEVYFLTKTQMNKLVSRIC